MDDSLDPMEYDTFTYVSNSTVNIVIAANQTLHDDLDLFELNQVKAIMFLPVSMYMVVLLLLGIVGNSFVCYIYKCRFRRDTSNFFIIFLAIMDLFCCVVGMTFEIIDLSLPYLFNSPIVCKLFRFLETWATGASGFILVCVALERYYKICKPNQRFSLKRAKLFCGLALLISLITAVPSLVVFGKRTVPTSVSGLNGTECSIDDLIKDSPFRIVFFVAIIATFLISLVCLVVLYSLIGFNLWQRKHKKVGEKLRPKSDYPRTHRFVGSDSSSFLSLSEESKKTQGYIQSHAGIQKTDTMRQAKGYKPNPGLGHLSPKTTRLTAIFLALSVLFVLCYLPWVVTNVFVVTDVAFSPMSSYAVELVYNFLVRTHFINNSVNAIVYSTLNSQFRKESKTVFKRIFKACDNRS